MCTYRDELIISVNAPHHFLKADEKMQEEAKSRDWIMARITSSEEAVAGEVCPSFQQVNTADDPDKRYQSYRPDHGSTIHDSRYRAL